MLTTWTGVISNRSAEIEEGRTLESGEVVGVSVLLKGGEGGGQAHVKSGEIGLGLHNY